MNEVVKLRIQLHHLGLTKGLTKHHRLVNPFPPSVPIWHRLVKLSILI